MAECKTGITYMPVVLNWLWRSVMTNGLMQVRSNLINLFLPAQFDFLIICELKFEFSFVISNAQFSILAIWNGNLLIMWIYTVYLLFSFQDSVVHATLILYLLQIPTIWEFNRMSMLNLVASVVKVILCFSFVFVSNYSVHLLCCLPFSLDPIFLPRVRYWSYGGNSWVAWVSTIFFPKSRLMVQLADCLK